MNHKCGSITVATETNALAHAQTRKDLLYHYQGNSSLRCFDEVYRL